VIDATPVTSETVISEVMRMKNEGYRFVTMSSAPVKDGFMDILYHFDKDMELRNFRLPIREGEAIPSISGVYFCAMLAENELQDLAGLKFDGLVLDYNRTLLHDSEVTCVPLVNKCKVAERK